MSQMAASDILSQQFSPELLQGTLPTDQYVNVAMQMMPFSQSTNVASATKA